ncbi:MAG: cytochrome c peroxidase [Bacteroidota bacterium]
MFFSNSNIPPLLFFFLILLSCKRDNNPTIGPAPTIPEFEDLSSIPYDPAPVDLFIPAPLPQMTVPMDNPLTEDGIELGRFLFYDPILSGNETMACANCHLPKGGFTDNLAFSTGVDGSVGLRSSMSLINAAYFTKGLFWDGRIQTLEAQALLPVEDPIELHNNWEDVEVKLRKHNDYPTRFRKAFGINNASEITKELAVKAIAQFERSLVSANSKYDRVMRKEAFFDDDELNGFELFFDFPNDLPDAECGHCHNAPLFTTNQYFNNGLDSVGTLEDFKDKGLGAVTNNLFDNGKFRAPSLRNIALTAPYMHDGRFQTLDEVIDHYNEGAHFADNIDPLIRPEGMGLSEQHKKDLIAFLHALTDTSFVNNPAYQNPFE